MTAPQKAPGDRIAASYDAVAETYAEKIGDEMAGKPIDRAWLNCLAELAASTQPAGIVADVGCGPGHVAAYLAGQGRRWWASICHLG